MDDSKPKEPFLAFAHSERKIEEFTQMPPDMKVVFDGEGNAFVRDGTSSEGDPIMVRLMRGEIVTVAGLRIISSEAESFKTITMTNLGETRGSIHPVLRPPVNCGYQNEFLMKKQKGRRR